jgi:hypothetical protein
MNTPAPPIELAYWPANELCEAHADEIREMGYSPTWADLHHHHTEAITYAHAIAQKAVTQ